MSTIHKTTNRLNILSSTASLASTAMLAFGIGLSKVDSRPPLMVDRPVARKRIKPKNHGYLYGMAAVLERRRSNWAGQADGSVMTRQRRRAFFRRAVKEELSARKQAALKYGNNAAAIVV